MPIPNIIHTAWIGTTESPKSVALRAKIKELHPTWEHRHHTDTSSLLPKWRDAYEAHVENRLKTDILRFCLLETQGGYWLDHDIILHHPLTELLVRHPDIGPRLVLPPYVGRHMVEDWLMACVPNAPAWQDVDQWCDDPRTQFRRETMGTYIMTNVWRRNPEDFFVLPNRDCSSRWPDPVLAHKR